jgi:2-polyprenyl-3-methyl-5-hydroxy-6-metoxy-1,4-benzoquinol methylase
LFAICPARDFSGPGHWPFAIHDLLAEELECKVDTLGFQPESDNELGNQYQLDLNTVDKLEADQPPKYSPIVFAEVLEHLYTFTAIVLQFRSEHLMDNGILVVQTPNAAALTKRVKLVLGRNPYDLINVDRENQKHFRKYKMTELRKYADSEKLEIFWEKKITILMPALHSSVNLSLFLGR